MQAHNAAFVMSVREWLNADGRTVTPRGTFSARDVQKLHDIVERVCVWIDAVHACPPPEVFRCELEIYGKKIGPFPLEGCDVEWDDSLRRSGVLGTFTPAGERTNPPVRSRHLILLAPFKHESLTLVHEIGHLAHTTWLAACRRGDIVRFRRALESSDTFKKLVALRNRKRFEYAALEAQRPGDPRNAETAQLEVIAIYDASYEEWFARVYVWMILRMQERERDTLRAQEFGRKAIDGTSDIYPPERELDALAKEMLQIFLPGFGRKLPWSQHHR